MKKKLISLLLSGVMMLSAVPMANADEYDDVFVRVYVNGEGIFFVDQNPEIIDGRTLVPVRAVVEEIGATVDWDDATQTATVSKDETTLTLTIDKPVMTVNGAEKALDVAPTLINDRTMLPIRAVAEELGCKVGWDENVGSVIITDWNAYNKEISENCQSLCKFLEETKVRAVDEVKADGSVKFEYLMEYLTEITYSGDEKLQYEIKNFDRLSVEWITDSAYKNDVIESKNVIKMDLSAIQNFLEMFIADDDEPLEFDFTKLDEVKINMFMDNESLYVNTNLLEELDEAVWEEKPAEIKALYSMVDESKWVKFDLVWLMLRDMFTTEEIEEIRDVFSDADIKNEFLGVDIKNEINMLAQNGKSLKDLIPVLIGDVENDRFDAIRFSEIVEGAINYINDDCLVYEKAEDGGYTLSFEFDTEDYIKKAMKYIEECAMYAIDEDGKTPEQVQAEREAYIASELEELKTENDILCKAELVCDKDGNIIIKADFLLDSASAYSSMKLGVDFDADMTIKVDGVEDAVLPTDCVDGLEIEIAMEKAEEEELAKEMAME